LSDFDSDWLNRLADRKMDATRCEWIDGHRQQAPAIVSDRLRPHPEQEHAWAADG
jgi:hypothetical protein